MYIIPRNVRCSKDDVNITRRILSADCCLMREAEEDRVCQIIQTRLNVEKSESETLCDLEKFATARNRARKSTPSTLGQRTVIQSLVKTSLY